MSASEALPQVSPNAYLDPELFPTLPREELLEHAAHIGQTYADKSDKEIREAACTDEERLVLESLLRFIDSHLPRRPGQFRAPSSNNYVRLCNTIAKRIVDIQFIDLDTDDLRQEARMMAIRRLRRYDSTRSDTPMGGFSPFFPGILAHKGALALKSGFSYPMGGGHSLTPQEQERVSEQSTSYSQLRRAALDHPYEDGWSDEVTEMKNHPNFRETTPLTYVLDSNNTVEQPDFGEQALVPKFDSEYPNNELADFDGTPKLDEVLAVIAQHINLSDREVTVLKARFEQEMTLEEVGKQIGRTGERVRQIQAGIFYKIERSPQLLKKLSSMVEALVS